MSSPVGRLPQARMLLADEAPPLPVVELRPGLTEGLRHAPSNRWREALLSAGLLAEVCPSDHPDDPRGWMLALQGLLAELIELEERRDGLMWIDDRLFLNDAPWWTWGLLLFQPWLALTLGQTRTEMGEQFVLAGLVYIIPFFIAVVICVATVIIIQRKRLARKEALQVLRNRIAQLRQDLIEGSCRTLARNFVARSGDRLLVCTPSLSTVSAAERARLSAEVERLKQSPPEGWVDLVPQVPDPVEPV